MTKQLYLVSLGCPKNLVDSEIMLALLEADGYTVCSAPEEADLIIVNTCGFIQPAVEEAIDEILTLARLKENRPWIRLVVAGCLVERYQDKLLEELPEVDLFVGVNDFPDITSRLNNLNDRKKRLFSSSRPFLMEANSPRRVSTPPHRAYLKISEGCSNRCSYCLIPSIRGPLRSRGIEDLVTEALRLGDGGVRELTLIGQDVTAYGIDQPGKDINLPALLRRLLHRSQVDWFRLLYLYPNRVSDELLSLMADNERLVNYLDIPLQHISEPVLQRMKRPFASRQVYELIERIRKKIPDAAIRTTFIVGFPGETEEDVEKIADFLRTYRLNNVGIFTYSNEEGCRAATFAGQCPQEEKEQRYRYLMELQAQISLAKNLALVGQTLPVLVEGVSKESELLLEGRTQYQAPDIDGCVYITEGRCQAGDIVTAKISEAHPYDLVGEIVGTA